MHFPPTHIYISTYAPGVGMSLRQALDDVIHALIYLYLHCAITLCYQLFPRDAENEAKGCMLQICSSLPYDVTYNNLISLRITCLCQMSQHYVSRFRTYFCFQVVLPLVGVMTPHSVFMCFVMVVVVVVCVGY